MEDTKTGIFIYKVPYTLHPWIRHKSKRQKICSSVSIQKRALKIVLFPSEWKKGRSFFLFLPCGQVFVTSGKFALYNPVQWRSLKEGMTLNCTYTFIYFGPSLLHKIINQQHLNPRFVFHFKGFVTSGKKFHQCIFHWIGPTEEKNAISLYLDASRNKNICATIRIGQEIWCLPYAGFFNFLREGYN